MLKRMILVIFFGIMIMMTSMVVGEILVFNVIKKEIHNELNQNLRQMYAYEIEATKRSLLSGAITLSFNKNIQLALKTKNRDLALNETKKISQYFRSHTDSKELKIHIHTKNLNSFVRSWKPLKYGDYLGDFRKTLVYVKRSVKPLTSIEIGRYGIMIRAIVPVVSKSGKYLGSLEFMEKMDKISQSLEHKEIFLAIIMSKKYLKVTDLIKTKNEIFSEYILMTKANSFNKKYIDELKEMDSWNFDFHTKDFHTKDFHCAIVPIISFDKEMIGYAIVGKKTTIIEKVINYGINNFMVQLFITGIIGFVVLLFSIYFLNKKVLLPIKNLRENIKKLTEELMKR